MASSPITSWQTEVSVSLGGNWAVLVHLSFLHSSPCSAPINLASLVAQLVKNPPAMWETWVRSLGWEDPLEEGMVTHSSILAWRIPIDRGARWATVHRVAQSQTRVKQLSMHAVSLPYVAKVNLG